VKERVDRVNASLASYETISASSSKKAPHGRRGDAHGFAEGPRKKVYEAFRDRFESLYEAQGGR